MQDTKIKSEPSHRWSKWVFCTVLWLVICFGVAGFGSWLTSTSIGTWYTTINKPSWNPPNWIFPVVWTTLFAMMGLAAGRIHWKVGFEKALVVFSVHLVLNFLWSMLFFYFHQILWAGIEILFLEGMIVTTLILFWRRDKVAGSLLVPYAAWVAFATFLNWTIILLNR